jgi:glyoxylase-like metal-dependent hydrolase (beta-lactamase superfamily II)
MPGPSPQLTTPRRHAFKASRLTSSTFLLIEHDDIYDEHPFIYVKVVPSARSIVVIDTGCGGASRSPEVDVKSLRVFIDTVPVNDNGGLPLNKDGWEYVVICTHCHYDHICECSIDS